MSLPASSPDSTDPPLREPTARIPAAGERIGKYMVIDLLGAGAMGVVVRAFDTELQRHAALKVVRPRPARFEGDDTYRARLVAEARALARVSHPNVVGVYEVGLHEGLIFVAMELVDGVDLHRWLRQQPRSWREIVGAFEAAGRGLHQVHRAGLVHRDVKPANILVGDDGRVRVGDFGIARATFEIPTLVVGEREIEAEDFDLDATALTAEGRVVGTPNYMAPEQHCVAKVGPPADQYAFCVALYEELWHTRLFTDMRSLVSDKRRPPPEPPRRKDVPRWLFRIIARGLDPEPTRRWPTMADLCDALRVDPWSRRKIWIAVAGTTAVIGATLVAFALRDRPCEDSQSALAGIWDAPQRATVERVFADSPRPWAADAWAHTSTHLDAYAQEWVAMRHAACVATHAREEQTAEMLGQQVACLEGRRRTLAATTSVLARGGSAAIDHAFELVAGLRPIQPCGDPIALASAIEPAPESLRADVERVRTDLARGRALLDAGSDQDALGVAQTTSAAARELAYVPLVAEALSFEGDVLKDLGRSDEARKLEEEALWSATSTGHDEVAVEAALALVWIAGQHDHSLDDALRWSELAQATLRRSNDRDARILSRIDHATGAAYDEAAQYDEALEKFQSALDRIADVPDAIVLATNIRSSMANTWEDKADDQRAREILEGAIADAERALGRSHPGVLRLRGALGRILFTQGEQDRAIEMLTEELEGLRVAMGEDASRVAFARINLGIMLEQVEGREDEAVAMTELAVATLEGHGDYSAVATGLFNLGITYFSRGAYDAAADRFDRAIDALERIFPEDHPEFVSPLLGRARVFYVQHRYEESIATYDRAERIARASSGPWSRKVSSALNGRAMVFAALERHTEALADNVAALEITRRGGNAWAQDLPLDLAKVAGAYSDLERYAEALPYTEEAAATARDRGLHRMLAIAELERSRALEGLGRIEEATSAAKATIAAAELGGPSNVDLLEKGRKTAQRLGTSPK